MPAIYWYSPHMSDKQSAMDPMVKKAASLIICFLGLKVPEAMQAAKFSDCESQITTIQMQVYCLYKKESNTSFQPSKSPPPSVVMNNLSPISLISLQTKKTSTTVTQNVLLNPKMKQIRTTSTQKQQQ